MTDPNEGWRKFVMEANAATGFQPATAADFGPVTFHGNRTADDPATLLDGRPLEKWTWIDQRRADLFSQIPSFEQVQELRLEALGYKNRIADLTRHQSEGGFGLDAAAPLVVSEMRKLQRAERELTRLSELKEVRSLRWNATGQLRQSVNDWVLRGIPGNCTLDVVEDAPLSELMTKADGGRIEAAVGRYQLRQRECAAGRHRVNSQQWPISLGEADAKELIERRADAAAPNLELAIEHGKPISFATTTQSALVHNAQPGAVAFIEAEDAVGLVCWLLGPELLKKISAGFREMSDGNALDQQQRETMLATIDADDLLAQRAECSLIWAAAERGEIIDFRPTTSPQAVLGVALRTVPHADALPETTAGFSWPLRR
ncbi:hypothetical protein HU675_0016255 [Bradyrhizobium septentrionale]|uniref:hypothetical protein n=1 Tax=Bradyrhizobium septentrionale TaxID=1404411 RepID=UPI0015966E55|nr:hypothetical protein [Bradyrhizobium septentrionale]UGY28182.1 hypothetical protein HU675_0016255 [Bradyrhizobium septentrionale]